MATKDNLAEAFAGESQANRKYLAFAKQAEKDGLNQVAKLFRAAAAAETVHAHAHLKAMGGIKTTIENLEAAVEGETHEFDVMYPPFIKEAHDEGDKAAERSFQYAYEVEGVHANLYKEALASVKDGKDLAETKIFVCEICGNTVYGQAPEKCSVCGVPASKFTEIL